MMRVLTVLPFLAGSGSLLVGCDAFVLRQHRLLKHHHHHHLHPKTESLIQQHKKRPTRSVLSTCSTTTQNMRRTDAIRSCELPRPHVHSSFHIASAVYRCPPSRKHGRLLPSSHSSSVPLVLGATNGNEGGSGGDSSGVEEKVEILSRQAKLLVSVMIDLIGMSSYVLPGMGEVRKRFGFD